MDPRAEAATRRGEALVLDIHHPAFFDLGFERAEAALRARILLSVNVSAAQARERRLWCGLSAAACDCSHGDARSSLRAVRPASDPRARRRPGGFRAPPPPGAPVRRHGASGRRARAQGGPTRSGDECPALQIVLPALRIGPVPLGRV